MLDFAAAPLNVGLKIGDKMLKDLQGTFIFAVCLLGFTAIVFFFKYGQERAQSKILEAENMASQNRIVSAEMEAGKRVKELERLGRIASASAKANIEKAREAREMLERAKASSAASQREIVARLNAQLEREADARISAEKASAELAAQRDILRKSAYETRRALEALRAKRSAEGASEILRMANLLKARDAEIEALKKRQAELERLRDEAIRSQMETEREIESRGGTITVSRNKLIYSPNIRSAN